MAERTREEIREMQVMVKETCKTCRGIGRKESGSACDRCQGKGERIIQIPFRSFAETVKAS